MTENQLKDAVERQLDEYEKIIDQSIKQEQRAKPPAATPPEVQPKYRNIRRVGRFSVSLDNTAGEDKTEWIWKDWLQKGGITLLTAPPGEGKSNIAAYFAAKLSTGGILPDGKPCRQGHAVIWSSEDAASTIRARCAANGGDHNYIHIIAGETKDTIAHMFLNEQDRDDFLTLIKSLTKPDLIVIDNIMNIMCGRDPNNNIAVRKALAPFVDLAERYNIAILMVAHVSKSGNRYSLAHSTLGSVAFSGVARTQLHLAKRAGTNNGILVRSMTNLTANNGGYPYELHPTTVGKNAVETVQVTWGEHVEGYPQDLLAEYTSTLQSAIHHEIDDWLLNLLTAPQTSQHIYAEATRCGYSRTAVKTAKRRLNIRHRFQSRANSRGGSITCWYPPKTIRKPRING